MIKKKFQISYCKECVIPNTRPDIYFDKNGVCSACNNVKLKKKNRLEKKKKRILKHFIKT